MTTPTTTKTTTPTVYDITKAADQRPEYGAGHFSSEVWIEFEGSLPYRYFKLGGWDATGAGRIVDGGPMVQGPHLYGFGRSSIMAANPEMSTGGMLRRAKADGQFISMRAGDLIRVAGATFAWRLERREYVKFTRVA